MSDKVIEQDWGYELRLTNKEDYCGKILVFKEPNAQTKLHMHKNKDKTWFVNTGKFKVMWIDTKNGKIFEQELNEGHTFNAPPMTPCQLTALVENSSISESSNSGDDADVFFLS